MNAIELKHVLHVEDNYGDSLMIAEAFKTAGIAAAINVVTTGEEAPSFLRRQGSFADAAQPDLMILDLNLPVRSGRQVLDDISNDANLRGIVVAILTSSPRGSGELPLLRRNCLPLLSEEPDL